MSEQQKNRVKWLHLRLTNTEYNNIHTSFKKSTKRKLSEYLRSVLLEKPITFYTRNQSYDDFVAEMILLRKELSALGNNFNQAVKKLHTMDHQTDMKYWALLNENSKQILFNKVSEINEKIIQITERWSQE